MRNDGCVCDVPGGNKTPYSKDYATWCAIKRNCFQAHRVATRGKRQLCEDWKLFSNFQKWFHMYYQQGYVITTDIASLGSNTYSPNTCAYVPKWLQSILSTKDVNGYCWRNTCKAYIATLNMFGKNVNIGTFQLEISARLAYLTARYKYLNLLANEAYDQDIINEETYAHLKNRAHDIKHQCMAVRYEHKDLKAQDHALYVASCKLVQGVGVNDLMHSMPTQNLRSYQAWARMLKRCYNKVYGMTNKTYKGCSVCESWLKFSEFKTWYDANYIEGCDLDKDLLVYGNKQYGPTTCCFIPHWLNSMIVDMVNVSTKYGFGVTKSKKKYSVSISKFGKRVSLKSYTTLQQAKEAYLLDKKRHFILVANEAFDQGIINEEVYAALRKMAKLRFKI